MIIYHSPLRITTPVSRVNDSLQMSEEHWAVLNAHKTEFVNKNYKHPDILNGSNDIATQFRAEFLSHSFVYVAAETVGNYPYPYFTEKTWKAMVSSMPFMIIGARHSLKKLREFGFWTFDSWWDEEYDNCLHVADRIKHVALELEKICALDYDSLENYRKKIQPVVDHNRSHLLQFYSNDLKNVQIALQS
jgi:hypothetical protein